MQVSGTKVTNAFAVSGGTVRKVSVSGLTRPIWVLWLTSPVRPQALCHGPLRVLVPQRRLGT